MKKFITSSLVTITALSSLAGVSGIVGASTNTTPVVKSSISSVKEDSSLIVPDAVSPHASDFFESHIIAGDNVVNEKMTTKQQS